MSLDYIDHNVAWNIRVKRSKNVLHCFFITTNMDKEPRNLGTQSVHILVIKGTNERCKKG